MDIHRVAPLFRADRDGLRRYELAVVDPQEPPSLKPIDPAADAVGNDGISDSDLSRIFFRLRRRRMSQGQGKREVGAAARPVAPGDFPPVSLDYRPADWKAESNARRRRLPLAAGELLEYRLLAAPRQSGAVIGHG